MAQLVLPYKIQPGKFLDAPCMYFYLFVVLFYDVFQVTKTIASNDSVIKVNDEIERKWSWPNFKVLFRNSRAGTEENHENLMSV
jgi:hypothetical protein